MKKMSHIALHVGRMSVVRSVSFCVISTLSCSQAFAQNAIQALTGSVQSGVEIVRIETAEPLTAVPAGFTIQSPARIALDFPGVVNGIGRSAIEIGQGNLRSANVVQAGDRTRVVINLKQSSAYQAKLEERLFCWSWRHHKVSRQRPRQWLLLSPHRHQPRLHLLVVRVFQH